MSKDVAVAATLMFGLLLAAQRLSAQESMVHIYTSHLEADGMRFDTTDQLREYLLTAPKSSYGTFVEECVARSRQGAIQRLVLEVLRERLAARKQQGVVNITSGSVSCP
jgi:hypothetical protein